MKKQLLPYTPQQDDREPLTEGFFLKRNVIKLCGEITDELATLAVSSLLYLDYIFKSENVPREQRELNVWINSPGGSVTAGMAIYDAMNFVDADIRTTCVGQSASMGAFLLSAGTRGKREALPHSEIMIHQPLGAAKGQATDILLYADRIKNTREELNRLLSIHTGQPVERIRLDTERDNLMTAEEARAYGLIDKVIETPIKAAIAGEEAKKNEA